MSRGWLEWDLDLVGADDRLWATFRLSFLCLIHIKFSQFVHIEVFPRVGPTFTFDVSQPRAAEHERALSVGKCPYNAGAAAEFFHHSFEHVVRTDTAVVFAWEGVVTEAFYDAFSQYLGRLFEFHSFEFDRNFFGFALTGGGIFLGVDRFEHGGDFFAFGLGHFVKDVAMEVKYAALPGGFWIKFGQHTDETFAFIGDDETGLFEPSFL